MGIYGRDYMRPDSGGPGGERVIRPAEWSLVTWLIVANVGIFLVQHLFFSPSGSSQFWQPAGGVSWDELAKGKIYLLLTSMFVHANFGHLLFNCVGLYFIGRFLSTLVSPVHFLKVLENVNALS